MTARTTSLTGWILTSLLALFLLFDATIHILRPQFVVDAFAQQGWPLSTAVALGISELIWLILFVTPRTAFFGAVLLTGHLGGATAAHLRAGQPFWFPVLFGILVWVAVTLRDARLRAYITAKG